MHPWLLSLQNDPDHSTAIYHRFDELSVRNLLYLQSELAELKTKQEEFDREDWRTWKGDAKGAETQKGARDWKMLDDEARSGNGRARERTKLIADIRSKLKEYRMLMLQTLQGLEITRSRRSTSHGIHYVVITTPHQASL